MLPNSERFSKGEENVKTLDIAYAGRPDWTIKEVKSPRDYLEVEAVETSRDANGGLAKLQTQSHLER